MLDVGCGDGKITAEIARRLNSGSVLGVDPSTRMIAFAQAHFARLEYPNLVFAVADATSLPYRREFDLVVSFNALHWVRDQGAALRGIRAALRPAGRAFLEFVPQGPRKSLEDVVEETCASERWARYFAGHTPPYVHLAPEQFRELASGAELRVERLERELKSWDFKSRQAFADWAAVGCIAWTERISASRAAGVHRRRPGPLRPPRRGRGRRRPRVQILSVGGAPARCLSAGAAKKSRVMVRKRRVLAWKPSSASS